MQHMHTAPRRNSSSLGHLSLELDALISLSNFPFEAFQRDTNGETRAYDSRNSEPDATWNNRSRNEKLVSVLYLNQENAADHHVHLEDRRDDEQQQRSLRDMRTTSNKN